MELKQEEILCVNELATASGDDSSDSSSSESFFKQNIYSLDSSSEEIDDFIVEVFGKNTRHTIENYLKNVVPTYTEKEFKTHFRVSRDLFLDLCAKMEVSEEFRKLEEKKRYSSEMHLALFLWFAGHEACSYRDVADRFGLSLGTVCNIINRAIMFFSYMAPENILWPSAQEMKRTSDYINSKTGLKGIIGAIDGTHIRIDPPKIGKDDYIDRKGVISICMQGICNERRKFIDFFIGYPGSTHDNRVFQNSEACERVENIPEGHYIIGDSAYQCSNKLITPFKDNGHLSSEQKYFNKKIGSARVIIEHSFGMLKQRFRQLYYCKLKGVKKICHFVRACVVLHNLCIGDDENIIVDESMETIDENVEDEDYAGTNENISLRNRLCEELYFTH